MVARNVLMCIALNKSEDFHPPQDWSLPLFRATKAGVRLITQAFGNGRECVQSASTSQRREDTPEISVSSVSRR